MVARVVGFAYAFSKKPTTATSAASVNLSKSAAAVSTVVGGPILLEIHETMVSSVRPPGEVGVSGMKGHGGVCSASGVWSSLILTFIETCSGKWCAMAC